MRGHRKTILPVEQDMSVICCIFSHFSLSIILKLAKLARSSFWSKTFASVSGLDLPAQKDNNNEDIQYCFRIAVPLPVQAKSYGDAAPQQAMRLI